MEEKKQLENTCAGSLLQIEVHLPFLCATKTRLPIQGLEFERSRASCMSDDDLLNDY
jgi:hypothetical protein